MKKIIISIILTLFLSQLYGIDLTLEKSKEIALKNNPELLAAKENMLSARADKWNSLTQFLPSLQTNASYTTFRPTQTLSSGLSAENSKSYGFTVTQPLFQGGKIFLNAQIKNNVEDIQEENFRSQKLQTISNVEEKYFNVLKNKELLEIAKLDLKTSKTNLKIAKTKYESGILSRADYLQILSEKSSKDVNFLQMQNLYDTSLMDLAHYLQVENIENIQEINPDNYKDLLKKIQNLSVEKIEDKANNLQGIAFEKNPGINISQLSLNTAKKTMFMAGGNFLPSLNLSYNKNYSKYDFMDDYEDSGSITFAASLPLFPIVDNATSLAEAKHNLKKTEHQYQSVRDGIKLATKSSFVNMVSYAKTVNSAEIALEQAQETYDQMQKRFSLGQISANELLSTQTMLLSAKNQYITSFFDFLKSRSSLQQQLGIEDTTKLIKIINL